MKTNQKLAQKAMIVAALSVGVVSINSMFNEVQASGQTMVVCPGNGQKCIAKITINGTVATIESEKTTGGGTVVVK